ncbi:MAG: hypothetical protein PVJ01_04460 [Pseudomonadota bacterium]
MLTFLRKYLPAGALILLFAAGWVPSAFSADNAATGGIGGINNGTLLGGDGTGSARITLNVSSLALVKQARDLSGGVIPDGSDVVSGQEIYFVIFVDNPSPYAAADLRVTDQLNETEFTYIPGTIETTDVLSGSDDAAIWAGTWSALTDSLGGPDDGASLLDTGGPPERDRLTIGSVPGQANQPVDIPGSSIRAFRFRARVN